jgi:hypothetical protein
VINKIEFSAKNLTFQHRVIFDLIDHDLFFDNATTNKIKMNHIKTMLCGNFAGIDKLERLNSLISPLSTLHQDKELTDEDLDDLQERIRKRRSD